MGETPLTERKLDFGVKTGTLLLYTYETKLLKKYFKAVP